MRNFKKDVMHITFHTCLFFPGIEDGQTLRVGVEGNQEIFVTGKYFFKPQVTGHISNKSAESIIISMIYQHFLSSFLAYTSFQSKLRILAISLERERTFTPTRQYHCRKPFWEG